ncbi:hypothetical protein HK099_005434, partial [Clydaea vesicula]
MTEKNVVDFIVAIAQKAKSKGDLNKKLLQVDLPENEKTKAFAQQLFDKIPRK